MLQPNVKELRSYVKDSTDFIREINNLERISESSIVVTMHVRSLYNEGIKAVETTLKRKNIATRIITTCFNSRQFYFQLPKLLTNKRLCHVNKMRCKLRRCIHGYISREVYIFPHKQYDKIIPVIHRLHFYNMDGNIRSTVRISTTN